MKLDLTKEIEAQDILFNLMQEKGFSLEKAIQFAINENTLINIVQAGWGKEALQLWGSTYEDKKWYKLSNPVIEVNLTHKQETLLEVLMNKEKTTKANALALFLLFTMKSLGHHI